MVTQWTNEESGITIYIHTAFANSEDGTVDFTLEPEEPEEGEDAPIYLYTGQYEDDEDPTESEDPEDYIWTYTGYDPAQEPDTSEAGDIEEPVELDPLVEAGLPEEAARMIRENRTDFEGNQDATDQTITNPNELVGTNHGASGYTVTSGLTAAAISDPVYAEGESAIRCCRITCQAAGANASVSFGADELEQKILDALDTLEENSVFTYTLSFDVRMSNPAVTGDITLGDLLTFPAFDPDDYIIGEDDPEPDDEGAEEEAAAGDEEAEPDPDGSEVDDEADDQAGPVDITDIWVHYSATADVDQSGTAGAALTIPVTMASGDTLDIANLKIEAGAMATAWKVSAIEAEAAARAAQAAADAAMEMAQATNKHFFYANSTGVHIATVENDPDSGNNVLIDSTGMYIRDNTEVLAKYTGSEMRVGKEDASHVSMTTNGTYFYDRYGVLAGKIGQDEAVLKTVRILYGSRNITSLTPRTDSYGYTIDFTDPFVISSPDMVPTTLSFSGYGTQSGSFSGKVISFKLKQTNDGFSVTLSTSSPSAQASKLTFEFLGIASNPSYLFGVYADESTPGAYSFAEGYLNKTSGAFAHAEGNGNTASGESSHAEGNGNTASGWSSHAEGKNTTASLGYSHAEGYRTTASGLASHAEGINTEASGNHSHAQNNGTIAASPNQTSVGRFNVADNNNEYALIIGNGADNNTRANALTVDWLGNVECGTVNGVDITKIGEAGDGIAPGASATLASGTSWVNVGSFTLTKGKWLVIASLAFASNAAGRRMMCLSTTPTGQAGLGYQCYSTAQATNGAVSILHCSRVVNVASTTTYYMNAAQNSGSSLTVYPVVESTRIV